MSQVAKFSIKLDWKQFNVDLNTVNDWMKANAGANYCGTQAAAQLELWFTDAPGQAIQDAIAAHWASLDTTSAEATAYKSQADRQVDVDAKKASAKSKLAALGLTTDEIAAILG